MDPIDITDHLALGTSWLAALVLSGGLAVFAVLALRRSAREAGLAAEARAATRGAVDLRDGARLVVGVAEPLDGETAISVKLFEQGKDIKIKNGWVHTWTETSREVEANPFEVVTEGGTRVRVEPDTEVMLHDDVEITARTAYEQRERTAVLTRGERVAITGRLRKEPGGAGAGYRETGSRWRLVRDGARPMLASTEPLDAQPARWAAFYRSVGIELLLAFAVLQVVLYFSFYDYALNGTRVIGEVVGHHTYRTTGRGAHTVYEIDIDAPRGDGQPGRSVHFTSEIGPVDYNRIGDGDRIVCIVTPSARGQLGSAARAYDPPLFVAGVLAFAYALVFVARQKKKRAWYEMRPVVTSGNGKLGGEGSPG